MEDTESLRQRPNDSNRSSESSLASDALARIHVFASETRQLAPLWMVWARRCALTTGLLALGTSLYLLSPEIIGTPIVLDRPNSTIAIAIAGICLLALYLILGIPKQHIRLFPLSHTDAIANVIADEFMNQDKPVLSEFLSSNYPGHVAIVTADREPPLSVLPLANAIEPVAIGALSIPWLRSVSEVEPVTSAQPSIANRVLYYANAMIALLGVIYLVINPLFRFLRGATLTGSDYTNLAFLVFFALCLFFGFLTHRRNYFACCGGIIERKAAAWSNRSQVSLFLAAQSGLVIEQDRDRKADWNADLGSGARRAYFTLSRDHIQVFLSCWLSPVPPPDPSRVSDFE